MNDQAELLRRMMEKSEERICLEIDNENKSYFDMNIITVASGKGGVGKSNFSVNLGLAMQELGNRCLILDADFGLANIEIILGERPKYNISHLIKGEKELKDVVSISKYGIPFISGGSGIKEMNFLSAEQIDSISTKLSELNKYTDNLIIDTGAGINDIVIKFCKLAGSIYIVVTPEPTSVTDGYALIKTLIAQFNVDTPIKVIVNKASDQREANEVFNKLYFVTKEFLNREIEYGGFIPYDENLFKSAKEQVPMIKYNSKSKSSQAYYNIANSAMGMEKTKTNTKENWRNKFKKIFSN